MARRIGSLSSLVRAGRLSLLMLLAAAALLVLAPSAGAAHDDAPVDDERHPNTVANGPDDGIRLYTLAMSVTYEEAERRVGIQGAVRAFRGELSEVLGDSYAGVWIQHEPEYRIFAGALREDVPIVASLLESESFADEAEVAEVGHSLEDLRAAASRVREVSPVPVDTGIDSSGNAAKIYVAGDENRRLLDDALAAAGLATRSELVRSELVVETVQQLSQPSSHAHGGLPMGGLACTAGFSVRRISDGALGVISAAHCGHDGTARDENVTIDGSAAPFQEGRQDGSWDVQWHTVPGHHITNEVEYVQPDHRGVPRLEGLREHRSIAEVRHSVTIDEENGDLVCKWGLRTGLTCGHAIVNTYCPNWVKDCRGTFIRVRNDAGRNMSYSGDSGGPVFYLNEAIGVVSGHSGSLGTFDSIYICLLGSSRSWVLRS